MAVEFFGLYNKITPIVEMSGTVSNAVLPPTSVAAIFTLEI